MQDDDSSASDCSRERPAKTNQQLPLSSREGLSNEQRFLANIDQDDDDFDDETIMGQSKELTKNSMKVQKQFTFGGIPSLVSDQQNQILTIFNNNNASDNSCDNAGSSVSRESSKSIESIKCVEMDENNTSVATKTLQQPMLGSIVHQAKKELSQELIKNS